MSSTDEAPAQPPSLVARIRALVRDKAKSALVDGLILGLPLLLLQRLWSTAADRLIEQPWQSLWVVVPLGLLAALLLLGDDGGLQERRRFLIFLGCFVLVFSIASQSQLLNWNRTLDVFGEPGPWSRLAPAGAGDWRYNLMEPAPPAPLAIMVVLMPPDEPATRRWDLTKLIALMLNTGVRAVALDFFFDAPMPRDDRFCSQIERGSVILGYTLESRDDGQIRQRSMAETLRICTPQEQRGHTLGLREPDGKVRHLPLFFDRREDRPSLSLALARLAGHDEILTDIGPSTSALLQFTESPAITTWTFEELQAGPLPEDFAGSLVLIGEDSERDSFDTPIGRKPGVEIHAASVNALLTGHRVHRPPGWISLAVILAVGYWITLQASRRQSAGRMLAGAAAASLLVGLGAAASIRFGLVWIDIAYPIASFWILLGGLLVSRRRLHAES